MKTDPVTATGCLCPLVVVDLLGVTYFRGFSSRSVLGMGGPWKFLTACGHTHYLHLFLYGRGARSHVSRTRPHGHTHLCYPGLSLCKQVVSRSVTSGPGPASAGKARALTVEKPQKCVKKRETAPTPPQTEETAAFVPARHVAGAAPPHRQNHGGDNAANCSCPLSPEGGIFQVRAWSV